MKRAVLALRPILVTRPAVPNLLTNLRSISTSVPAKVFHSDLTDVDLPDFTFSQMCWSRLDQFSEEVLHQNWDEQDEKDNGDDDDDDGDDDDSQRRLPSTSSPLATSSPTPRQGERQGRSEVVF